MTCDPPSLQLPRPVGDRTSGLKALSDKTSRSTCTFPVAQPALYRDTGRPAAFHDFSRGNQTGADAKRPDHTGASAPSPCGARIPGRDPNLRRSAAQISEPFSRLSVRGPARARGAVSGGCAGTADTMPPTRKNKSADRAATWPDRHLRPGRAHRDWRG